ncbi:MAG: UDP-N-acetylmuramoyl-L-alanyl-D-glutamate--2,6-diaminopimelate ligase [Candidatus Komeilibacteria bacterium]|nr:UDP-N-acetylmuramoyl-L-alanyl-D-glutamate--2,6-diaminopimelate ligase [Candidatus Komeilibacteria bacterium]
MWQQLKNIYHLFQAVAANQLYGFPSRKLFVIGVTGTDGKTTTASIIFSILRDSGKKTIKITTLGATINDKELATGLHVTTPSSFEIQRLFAVAVREGCTHAILEVSSHALDQNRVFGIRFAIGVLTNISHEHLDYHKTIENYTRAKTKLLQAADIAVINQDDPSYAVVADRLGPKKITTYALNAAADVTPFTFPFTTQLFGGFNRYNCLAAAAAAAAAGIDNDTILRSIASFKNPRGRQDIVYNKEFKVMIDFAVTPKAFESILSEIKKGLSGRLIHVFGLSGKRDSSKRPIMGDVASRYDDIIILTADDPRDEPVESINEEIIRGIHGFTRKDPAHHTLRPDDRMDLFEIPDRGQAIIYAISLAQPGDFVLLTGKGHEQSLAMKEGDVPWDEYKAVEEALAKRLS